MLLRLASYDAVAEAIGERHGPRAATARQVEFAGQRHEWVREFTVSSIDATGRLHFKGGNGDGAWPTEVEKVAVPGSS